jgi:hypothetical protein
MRRPLGFVLPWILLGLSPAPAPAQCTGDCDDSATVAVNELITCVNVSLGQQPLASCAVCDANGDQQVAINELIGSVNIALGVAPCLPAGTPTAGPVGTPTATRPPDTATQCCVPAYYIWQCEDRTVGECTALGGVDRGPAQCSAALCADLPPADGHGICCLPNQAGDEIECEDRAAAACLDAGGVVKSAGGVCLPETCADVLPPNPDVRCCVPSGGESECEDRSAAQCAAAGGVNRGPGVCEPTTCDGIAPQDIQCCVPRGGGDEIQCEDRTAEECADRGGVNMGVGDCDPDPCNP